jgi:hypothetical protein
MNDADVELLATLQALEVELHRPAARSDAGRLDALLHPEFLEFGRSGRSYTKADILDHLLAAATHATVVSNSFALRPLGPDVALLTYRAAHRGADGGLERHTLRCSIWQRGTAGWQMSFHQGTPTEPTESDA